MTTTVSTPADLGDAAGFGVKLYAGLPDGDANGFRPWARLLAQQPTEHRYAVIMLDVARVIDDLDKATDTAVVRILRVEIMSGDLSERAQDLMLSAANGRGADPSLLDEDGDAGE